MRLVPETAPFLLSPTHGTAVIHFTDPHAATTQYVVFLLRTLIDEIRHESEK